VRAAAATLRETCQRRVHELGELFVTVNDPPPVCATCGAPLRVRKTVVRHGMTLAHGSFHLREKVYACTPACQTRVQHAPSVERLLPPGSRVGYDVMVAVGLDRFVRHQQREEIRATLASEHGIALSVGEISTLARRFLAYVAALHQASQPALAAALAADGGYPLHLDATCEDGRGTLLVMRAGWRHWTLGAWKISTERAELILPRIQEVAKGFGEPCALIRDLGRAVAEATEDYVASLDHGRRIPIFACHYHLLEDIGRDLLTPGHDRLRVLFREAGVVPRLRAFAREHGRRLGAAIIEGRDGLRTWLTDPHGHAQIPGGQSGLTIVRGVAQWILDYQAESTDEGFPFDTPYLTLFERSAQVVAAIKRYLDTPPTDRSVKTSLERLQTILRPVACDVPPFISVATALVGRCQLFTQLRRALRVDATASQPVDTRDATVASLKAIEQEVTALKASLHAQRPARGSGKDTRQAIDIILAHLDRHGRYLWGHAIPVTGRDGPEVRLVDRTNNEMESFFHTMKRQERRRSGRKILTYDLECTPPAAALVANLTHADYVELVCASLQRLPEAFAKLDAADRSRSVALRAADSSVQTETASLSTADRRLVRMPALSKRILAASQACGSRAVSPRQGAKVSSATDF